MDVGYNTSSNLLTNQNIFTNIKIKKDMKKIINYLVQQDLYRLLQSPAKKIEWVCKPKKNKFQLIHHISKREKTIYPYTSEKYLLKDVKTLTSLYRKLELTS